MESIQLSFDSPKLCECGCGQPTTVAKSTDRTVGMIKGQPHRFIRGHNKGGGKGAHRCEDIIGNFWSKVRKTSGCWTWAGARNKGGYGQFAINGKQIRAHRFAFLLQNGYLPTEQFVCHHCDNPSCVRPDHLFLGTHKDNMQDMRRKGRGHTQRKNATILEMRALYSRGLATQAELSRLFSIGKSNVSKIVRNKTWAHLVEE